MVETGAMVANANSYVSLANCNTYLTSLGYAELTSETYLIRACEYVDSFRMKYKGYRYTSTQSLVFPRSELTIDGFAVAVDTIPNILINAQCMAAHFLDTGVDLFNNSSGQEVLSESVDVISVTYAQSGVTNAQPQIGIIQSFLRPMLRSTFNVAVNR